MADWLAGERRASAHTRRRLWPRSRRFLDFLTEHLGDPADLAALSRLAPADFRALLARRSADGIERSSLARGLSVLRGFMQFLERRGLANDRRSRRCAPRNCRRACRSRCRTADAVAAVETVGELTASSWQAKRDVAVLTLLYGCGLRISEALGLKRSEAPRGDVIAITGKGRKDRIVPVLPAVRRGGRRLSRRLSVSRCR